MFGFHFKYLKTKIVLRYYAVKRYLHILLLLGTSINHEIENIYR